MNEKHYSHKQVRKFLLILIGILLTFLSIMLIMLALRNLGSLFGHTGEVKPTDSTGISVDSTESSDHAEDSYTTSTDPADETSSTADATEEPTGLTETAPPTEPTEPAKPTTPSTKPGSKPGSSDEENTPPPSVTIPPEQDPETGEQTISFPCQIPGYDLVIEKLAPYTGIYVEDGTNQQIANVAMLMVSNKGTTALEYAEINVTYGDNVLTFRISALPAGEKVVVQEAERQVVPKKEPTGCSALVIQNTGMEAVSNKISVTDDGSGGLIIQNLTGDPIPTVRVFYKYYMAEEDVFIGGIAFTVKVSRLPANGSTTVRPSHFSSGSSRIVMISCYDVDA